MGALQVIAVWVESTSETIFGGDTVATIYKRPEHIPDSDVRDQRGRGPGIDMGRCVFLPEAKKKQLDDMLTARIQEIAPLAPGKPGPKPQPTLENEFKQVMEALERIVTSTYSK